MGYNPYIVVPFATWAVAQIAKFAIAAFKGRVDFRYLYASGGMPSVHSAVVCSLATTALLVDGSGSAIFGLTVIFAAIVMYDSFGVRRSAGEQAAAINMLISSLESNRVKLEQPSLHIREILGHQPKEVSVGAVVGVVLGGLFNYQHLGELGGFLQGVPGRTEIIAYAAVFVAIIIGGMIARFTLRAQHPKSKVIKHLASRILVATQVVGWVGLLMVLMAYEHASYLSWRLWPILVMVIGVVWGVVLAVDSYRPVREGLAAEQEEARKLKWLEPAASGKRRKSKRA